MGNGLTKKEIDLVMKLMDKATKSQRRQLVDIYVYGEFKDDR